MGVLSWRPLRSLFRNAASAQAHERLKQSLKELAREVFDAIDEDADDSISPEEQAAALAQPGLGKVRAAQRRGCAEASPRALAARCAHPQLGFAPPQVTAILEASFPVPSLSSAIEGAAISQSLAALLSLVDANGDGKVSRQEAYRAVSKFKKQFLEAATMLETMGPMLAAFGGGFGGPVGPGSIGRAGRGRGGASTGNVKVAKPTHGAPKVEL